MKRILSSVAIAVAFVASLTISTPSMASGKSLGGVKGGPVSTGTSQHNLGSAAAGSKVDAGSVSAVPTSPRTLDGSGSHLNSHWSSVGDVGSQSIDYPTQYGKTRQGGNLKGMLHVTKKEGSHGGSYSSRSATRTVTSAQR